MACLNSPEWPAADWLTIATSCSASWKRATLSLTAELVVSLTCVDRLVNAWFLVPDETLSAEPVIRLVTPTTALAIALTVPRTAVTSRLVLDVMQVCNESILGLIFVAKIVLQ